MVASSCQSIRDFQTLYSTQPTDFLHNIFGLRHALPEHAIPGLVQQYISASIHMQSRSWSDSLGGEVSRAESDGMSTTVNQRLPDVFKIPFSLQTTHFFSHVFNVAYELNMMSYAIHKHMH